MMQQGSEFRIGTLLGRGTRHTGRTAMIERVPTGLNHGVVAVRTFTGRIVDRCCFDWGDTV